MKTVKKTFIVVITLTIIGLVGYVGKLGYEEYEWQSFLKYNKTGEVSFPFSEHHLKMMQYEWNNYKMKNYIKQLEITNWNLQNLN